MIVFLGTYVEPDGLNVKRYRIDGELRVVSYYPPVGFFMPNGPSIVQSLWTALDKEYDEYAAGQATQDEGWKQYKKGRMRGIADCLSFMMVPHFRTADDIVREAVRRHKARQENDETYETAGLGGRRYDPPPGTWERERNTPKATVSGKANSSGISKLGPKEMAAIKQGKGFFKPVELAKAYGITVEEVDAIQAAP